MNIKNILELVGFNGLNDFLGTFAPYFPKILVFSVYIGSFVGFIETHSGISFLLWVFILAASIFDIMLGVVANIFFLKQPLETQKMFRGLFKAFVLLCIIFLTNTFKVGVEKSNISPDFLHTSAVYITASIHYISVILTGLYILLGIAENGAKIGLPLCVSLVKILKLKIKKIEDETDTNR